MMLPCLLEQIDQEENISSVSVEGAYDTKVCTRPLHTSQLMQPSRLAKTLSSGRTSGAGLLLAMPSWKQNPGLAGKCRRSGVAIIDAAP